MTRLTVVVLSLITISLILAGVSDAKIDKKDIMGICKKQRTPSA